MKKILRIMSLALAVVMIFTLAACGEKTSTKKVSTNNDDFFTDETDTISRDQTSSDTGTSKKPGKSGGSGNSDKNVKEISKQNKVGGKSWKDVLATMPKNLNGTTVKVYNWNPMSEYSGATEAIKEFTKQTGIKVEWQTINYDDYYSKLAALVASGESPDVSRTNTPDALGLQNYQPVSVTGYDFNDDAWDKILMKDYTINGKVYALNLKNSHIGGGHMLFYNKALINKYDLEDPYKLWKSDKWTWNKFLDMCKEFMNDSGATSAAGGNRWDNWAACFGSQGPIGYDGTKYFSRVGDANFIKITQDLADLYNTSKILKWWGADEFDRGELLFWSGHAIYARRKNSYFASLKKAGSLFAVPMPKIDGQSKYYQCRGEYEAYAIPKGAKNAKAVPYFLRYFLDAANYDMTSFFCNNQLWEVYNWTMNQENTIWSTGYAGGMADTPDGWGALLNIQGSQVKNFIDSNAADIDKRVDAKNKALNKLK